jgi:hypothetical protein
MPETSERLVNLRKWNIGVGGLHLVQGILILVLSSSFAIPIVAAVQTGPPGAEGSLTTASKTFFSFNFAIAIAIFLFLAAGDHLLTSVTPIRAWYERNLLRGVNYARWIEYSVSASIMILLICLLNGINNFYALVAIFGVNAAMILFGLVMEQVNQNRESVNWWPFIFGCIVGIIPWIAIVIALYSAATDNTMINGVPANADGQAFATPDATNGLLEANVLLASFGQNIEDAAASQYYLNLHYALYTETVPESRG